MSGIPLHSVRQLRRSIDAGDCSPEEVVEASLKRIKEVNDELNIFVTPIDKPYIDHSKKGKPLYGIPFSMKDQYVTAGIRTTTSSDVLHDYIPPHSATVYERLVDAGAVLVGKTNCDPWGHGSSTENSAFGPTRNPVNPAYVPGGSSGGSAAAVVAGCVPFDIGEDTGGSIRLPASFCGVVGLKTTYGLVPRYGAMAYASSLDTVGPIAQTVDDCACVMDVIAGSHAYDAVTQDTRSFAHMASRKKITIGIPREYVTAGVDKEVRDVFGAYMKQAEEGGVRFVDVSLPMTEYAISAYYVIAASETSSNLGRYDGIRYGKGRTHMGPEQKRRIMLGTYALSSGFYDAYYHKATQIRMLVKRDFDRVFEKVDYVLAPIAPTPPFKLGARIDDPLTMYLTDVLTVPINLAGIPSLAFPAGRSKQGLPIGLQLIGPRWSEGEMINDIKIQHLH